MGAPCVSVLMPAYNAEKYIQESVESVLCQSYKDFEFIIIDDGSTDRTASLIESYDDSRIQLIKNPCNRGLIRTLNKGLGLARGTYVARMDADDICIPTRLCEQVNFMEANKNVGICGTWIEVFGKYNFVQKYPTKNMEIKANLFLMNPLAHPSVIMRKVLLDQYDLRYSNEWKYVEDYELWQRALFCMEFANIPQVLLKYRTGEESICSSFAREQQSALLRLDERNAAALGFHDKSQIAKLVHSIRMACYPMTQEFSRQATADLLLIADANKKVERYPEPWFTMLLNEEVRKINEKINYAMFSEAKEGLAEQLSITQAKLANVQNHLNEIIASPEYKVIGLLKRVFSKIAPVGTSRRKLAKATMQVSYQALRTGHRLWQRAEGKIVLFRKKMFLRQTRNVKWPAENPLVSVVIPCFNYGKYIEEAVDSVLGQTFKDLEIIIVDGGSTDGTTHEILKKLSKPQTSIYYREGRHLVGDNRNFGIGLAKGKYICCLDADDMLEATYLEKALFFLETYRYDVVYPSVQCFGGDSIIWHASPTTFERMISVENAISTVAVFSREAWRQSGGYKDWPIGEGHVPEDWEFWSRLMGLGYRFKNIREPLVLYRVHQAGLTGQCKTSLTEQLRIIYNENCHLLTPHFSRIRKENNSTFFKADYPALNMKAAKHKKRILLALPFMIIGGADTILLRIFSSLRTEFDITVVTTLEAPAEFGDNTTEYKRITPEIYHLKRFLSDDLEMQDFVHYLIESREIDLLFIVGSEFVYDLLPEIKRKFPGLKVIDQLFNEFGHISNNRKYASLIDLNIVANNVISEIITGKYQESAEKVRVIIHGIDVRKSDIRSATEEPLPGIVGGKLTISYFGRFSNEKAPDMFVEIINRLQGYDVQAVMTGNGPEYSRTIDRITAYGLQDKIYAPGFVDDIRPYLEHSDILLVPSRIEGLPIIILEALSLGVPVIASDIGGISTVVLDGYNGYVCEVGNVGQFVDRIKELVEDQGLLLAMKKNAIDYAKDNISEEKMNAAYNEAINNVLQARR